MFRKKTKNYISDIDIFLQEFDKTHPKSEAQLAEIRKYEKVSLRRDKPIAENLPEDEFFS